LSFRDRFDILLKKRPGGVAELRYEMLYGKSRIKEITMGTNRRNFLKYSLGGTFAALSPLSLSSVASGASEKSIKKKNVLFIIVEDLKNIMGCYGNPLVKTPNIDRLAQRGVIFNRAYCQYPVCNPSRSSLLTGLRPDTTKILDNSQKFDEYVGYQTTLPGLFKKNGYKTTGLGKVFHGKEESIDPNIWSQQLDFGPTEKGKLGETRNMTDGKVKWCSWLAAEGDDSDQPDGRLADKTVELLKDKNRKKPFFIITGFHKPHDPFDAPKKYFDMYPLKSLMPPVVPDNREPENSYAIGSAWKQEFDKFSLQDKREFLRAYYACTTFTDAQIGKVIDALDDEDLWKDTVVLFIGDHGYTLGEHDWWNKNVLFEDSARIPMIAVVEGETQINVACNKFVEMVDIYPTFADLCGLKAPDNLEGISFRPLLGNPNQQWKKAAFTQVMRNGIAGKSVRTKRWRYTEWAGGKVGVELYDHASDPGEYRNLAKNPDFKDICKELSCLLN